LPLYATETGIRAGLVGQLARMQTLPLSNIGKEVHRYTSLVYFVFVLMVLVQIFTTLSSQVPLDIKCHRKNIVLALTILYIRGSASIGLEKAVNHSKNVNKVGGFYPLIYILYYRFGI